MKKTSMPPLIVILGPTASGKSKLALQLAEEFHGYIISADSRQVYRGMDIGTAKPTPEERRRVRHFLLDIVDPDDPFTVADYQRMAFAVLRSQRGLPFLVGGTGLYIDAVVENWDIPASGTDGNRRAALEKESIHLLVKRLQDIDPASTSTIDLNNKRRVIRALEVVEQTGESIVTRKKKRPFPSRVLQIGLSVPRDELVKRIDARVDAMMEAGLLDETRRLIRQYGRDIPSMSGLGYKQLGLHIRGDMTLEDAVKRIKIETRQYAKRQMTWWKKHQDIQWVTTRHDARRAIGRFRKKEGGHTTAGDASE
jgi:tRNA dimethylallyltransferase